MDVLKAAQISRGTYCKLEERTPAAMLAGPKTKRAPPG